jgi:hypothetical protein
MSYSYLIFLHLWSGPEEELVVGAARGAPWLGPRRCITDSFFLLRASRVQVVVGEKKTGKKAAGE